MNNREDGYEFVIRNFFIDAVGNKFYLLLEYHPPAVSGQWNAGWLVGRLSVQADLRGRVTITLSVSGITPEVYLRTCCQ